MQPVKAQGSRIAAQMGIVDGDVAVGLNARGDSVRVVLPPENPQAGKLQAVIFRFFMKAEISTSFFRYTPPLAYASTAFHDESVALDSPGEFI